MKQDTKVTVSIWYISSLNEENSQVMMKTIFDT